MGGDWLQTPEKVEEEDDGDEDEDEGEEDERN